MALQKVKTDYTKLRDDELDDKANHVEQSLTANPGFPAIGPQLALLTTAKDEYTTALGEAKTRDKTKVAIKNQKRQALIDVLKATAEEVNDTVAGDVAKLVSSGLDLYKERTPVGTLAAPTEMEVTPGPEPGQAKVEIKSAPHKEADYIVFFAQDPAPADDDDWSQKFSTTRFVLITGLESGKKYWFKASYVTTTGVHDFNQPQWLIVQ